MQPMSDKGRAWWTQFQGLLDDQMTWPSEYVFKFIVPQAGLEKLTSIFGQYPIQVRASRRGNYNSVTARIEMHSSDEVIALYLAAAQVDGVISL